MNEANPLDRRSLAVQLENYKLIIDANLEMFEKDPLLKARLTHKMGMLESCIGELDKWERIDDRAQYNHLLAQANALVRETGILVKQALEKDSLSDKSNLQSGQSSA